MRRHSDNFRRAGWIAVFAILLQTLVPLVHHPADAAVAGNVMHICSSMPGMAGRTADADKAPAQKAPPCPICQTLHLLGAGFVTPPLPALARADFAAPHVMPPLAAPIMRRLVASNSQPRAPPSLA